MSLPPLSILLIDEDERTRNFFGALLTRQGYTVQAASSGKEGFITALRDRPDVIIFDAGMSDMPAAELVRKLRNDKRSATTLLLALADPTDGAIISEVLPAGCNEFFFKTPEAVEKLLNMLDRSKDKAKTGEPLSSAQPRTGGLLGVFLGAKGGAGTSSMCANIAQNIAHNTPELDIAVMDLVLPIGSIASIVGHEGEFDIQAATRSLADLNKATLPNKMPSLPNWGFHLLGGSPDPDVAGSLDLFQLPEAAEALRQVYDLTLIDLGRSLSAANLHIIQQADVVVLVTGSDLATIKLTQTVLTFLKSHGVDQKHIYLLLNRSVGLEGLGKSDTERILGMEIRAATPYLGVTFALANNQHLPVMSKLPNDTAAMMLDQVSREILETARRSRV